jgi:hypothetical protein
VSDALIAGARRFALPADERDIDVGYRGRGLPVWLGRAAADKAMIGDEFVRRAADSGLRMDVSSREEDRLYGAAWHRFLGRCRAALGVESGISFLDLEDEVLGEYEKLVAELGREPTLEELERGALGRIEGNFAYRTISPRHLEAAAFGVCQVLLPGRYEGLLQPHVHYVPLEADYSNVDDVVAALRDDALRGDIVRNARRDLIDSGVLSYARFIETFDGRLLAHGLEPAIPAGDRRAIRRAVASMHVRRGLARLRYPVTDRLRARAYLVIAPASRRVRKTLHLPQKEP